MIEIRNLTKKYRELTVIDNFCHSFDGGKVYGIMGENGAGKSTLFRCIAGIESYDGSVVVNENKQIGYMNDTPFYYSYVTGMEHIEFCLRAKGKTISRDEIEQLNEKFALPLQRYASRYSLGMKKRLMLLTLMLQDNDIVIMDDNLGRIPEVIHVSHRTVGISKQNIVFALSVRISARKRQEKSFGS